MNGNFVSPPIYYHQNNPPVNGEKFTRNDNESRYAALKEAIAHKDKGSIVWLLNEGCPVNIPELDRTSESPLHVAVFVNDVNTARVLLSVGAQVNSINIQKQTPLHLAFEMRHRTMVDMLLPHCDGTVNPFTVYGLSHFHIACVRNDWRVANAFLQRGVNANVYLDKCFYGKDYVYYRPLHLAVKYENFEVAELLLQYGANINAKDRYKRTPLHLACRYNYKRISEVIHSGEFCTREDLMYLVKCKNEQVDIVKLLLRYGASIDMLDVNETPPLFHIFKSDFAKIKSVISEKLKINDDFWNDLLELFKSVQKEKFYALIQEGADVRFCNDSKETLVHLVIDGKRLFGNHVSTLVVKDRDLNDEEKAEIVDLLLKYGANVDAKTATGQTALHMAIASYYVCTVKTLLNNYASVNNVCFFHYKIPRRDATISCSYDLVDMENFLDIIGLILSRKSDFHINLSNELLMLRCLATDSHVQHLENCSIAELRRLLDFSDVNDINLSFCASENSALFSRDKIALLLEHVRKLEVAGLPVNVNVRREFTRCSRVVNALYRYNQAFTERCKTEIQRLKSTMIDRYASFYDLLFLNVNEIAVRVKNARFRRAIRSNCRGEFGLYGDMIVKQFVKGLLRSILLDSTKEHLSFIIEQDLPEPCLENIIGHLRNEDLCNLALAFLK